MKNFVKHTLAIAICAAALLSSCIKEESFRLDTVELTVTLTRADSESPGSQEQGDAINDVMIWAFPCTLNDSGAPTLVDGTKATGFTYATGLNLYQSISVHVPLTVCDGEQSYVIVAVINSPAFDKTISAFDSRTTWGALKSATFAKSGDFWNSYPKDLTPEQMPISNWATLTIKENNTHSNNQCYKLNLPVHRAVAKTQLYMSKAGNFKLEVLDAKVVANNGYSNGAVLTASAEQSTGSNSEAIQRGKPSEASTTWWWASPTAITRTEGATDPAVTYQLKNGVDGFTTSIETSGSTTNPGSGDFTWVASTFLLENDNEADYGVGVYDEPQGDGYNLYVKYQVDGGEPVEVYTPLGKVVRNHDYQVKATVDAGGELTFTIEVNQWTVEETKLDYQDIATINANGYIAWSDLPEVGDDDYHTWNYTNDAGQVVDNPAYADDGIDHTGVINLTSAGGTTAKFSFMLDAPKGGTWIAELRPIGGMANSIVFADGSSTMTGVINNELNELTIMNRADNLASAGGVENKVELRISAKGSWGGEERSYRVIGIAGDGFDADFNYTIIQPAQ
ncbi:MAG: hypothetical protein IJA96_01715 [Alistipes sp.]|nr:hypothetical protein [Alistipes sp.]